MIRHTAKKTAFLADAASNLWSRLYGNIDSAKTNGAVTYGIVFFHAFLAVCRIIEEKRWMDSLKVALLDALQGTATAKACAKVCTGWRLPYAHEIHGYSKEDAADSHSAGYETDLLVFDVDTDGAWIPRIVIEGKLGAVTTHDALTYSAKAATHKHVHPYLRYGILVGNWGGHPLPPRLVRHGAHFDFMAILKAADPDVDEWRELGDILRQELQASRRLQELLTDRSTGRPRYRVLHRPLLLTQQLLEKAPAKQLRSPAADGEDED